MRLAGLAGLLSSRQACCAAGATLTADVQSSGGSATAVPMAGEVLPVRGPDAALDFRESVSATRDGARLW
jgi:hypothetical protein